MWHLLGYNLPGNWGNAADWIVDAERFGLSLGKTPRVGSLAVFPIADATWALTTAGHVAFVSSVSADGSTFNVTYQNYGDPTPMFVGTNYPVSVINQPRYQNGNLRFIYFPRLIRMAFFSMIACFVKSAPDFKERSVTDRDKELYWLGNESGTLCRPFRCARFECDAL
jgi:hypothetical protein